jgi:endoglucanase
MLLNIAKNIKKKPDFTLYLVATCQEEVGLRGGESACKRINPDIAVVFEGTIAMDTPGNPEYKTPTVQGEGPAITVMDRSMIANPDFVEYAESIASKNKIKYQIKKPVNMGGTDAGKIHILAGGVPTCVVSVPCRYIHSAYGLIKKEDYDNMKKLSLSFAENFKVKDLNKKFNF